MDREAEFRRLYEAHRVAVHAYLAGRTVGRGAGLTAGRTDGRQSAADLTQDVFLRAWQHLDTLTGMTADRERAWLFTVARNLSIDAHRHQSTRDGVEQALVREQAHAGEPARQPQPASAAVIAAERVAIVGEAVRRLPEQQRVTLAMAAVGEMTSAEIGAVLGVPAGTVRYRLSLARRALAQALDDYDYPTEQQ